MPDRDEHRPVTSRLLRSAIAALSMLTAAATAQENPVYVNDSPAALAMLRQGEDQIRDNPGEAIRLFQNLLDEYPMKLVPVTDTATDQFISVRSRVLRAIRSHESLLERYQSFATPEAQRMLESGQFERLAVTRPLTEPGLEALLSLAQARFEDAHFNAALLWLDQAAQHPHCTGQYAAHTWYMTAASSHFLGDVGMVQHAQAQLEQSGDTGTMLLEQLRRIIADGSAPTPPDGRNVLSRTTPESVGDLIAQPIWTRYLDESLLHRRFVDPSIPDSRNSPVLEQRRREADLMTAAATVCGDYVYVSEGFRITAFDRYMGDVRWVYVDTPSMSLIDRENEQPMDLNIVAISGSSLVTLAGHAHSDHRSGTGSVLCLDRFTGQRRWETKLDEFAAGGDQDLLYPHGAPIIADGTVFLLARKVSQQRLASTYAVAIDLRTGRMRWSRYLTSSGGLHRAGRPITAPTYHDGSIYIATAIGAIARLDSSTGEILWLHRFNVPMNVSIQDQRQRPWEFSSPVIIPTGVVALLPDQRRIALLEANTGDLLQSFPASPNDAWGDVRYLLADDKCLYAIGRDIRAIAVDALVRPLWTMPPPATSRMVDDDSAHSPLSSTDQAIRRLDLRGRVQLASGSLIAPSLQGLLFIDSETGKVDHRLPVPGGNPVVVDAQLFHAGSDRLDAYMSFERAQRMLRQRIADRPDDPSPALSLLRLGIRVGDVGLALSAADLAHQAVVAAATRGRPDSSGGRRGDELFELLLSIDAREMGAGRDEAEALFGLLGEVASEPAQRVAHLLAWGDWLADHDVAAAVEVYQRLLGDEELRRVRHRQPARRGEVFKAACVAAAGRLAALIDRRGERVYAAQADFARRRLEQLRRDGTGGQAPNVDSLIRLAAEYPFAPAGVEAAMEAASRVAVSGDGRGAIGVLLEQYRLSGSLGGGVLLEGAAGHALAFGCGEQAAEIMGYARGFEEGRRGDRGSGLARVGSPGGQVVEIRGSVVERAAGAVVTVGSRFVTGWGTSVSLHDGAGGWGDERVAEALWTIDLGSGEVTVVRQTNGEVVVWADGGGGGGRLVEIDAESGEVAGVSRTVEQELGDATVGMIRSTELGEQLPDGRVFDPTEKLVLVWGDRVVVVRRMGDAVAFGLGGRGSPGRLGGDGAGVGGVGGDMMEPLWTTDRVMDQVHHGWLSECHLVLAGIARGGGGSRGESPRRPAVVVVIDPSTGRVVERVWLGERSAIRWMSLGPLGRLVYATETTIETLDVFTGHRGWSNHSYEASETTAGWVVKNTIVFQDRSRQLRSADLDTGEMTEAFDGPLRADGWDPYDLQDVIIADGRIFALYPRRVVHYSTAGRILGQDVVTDERDYRWLIPARDQLLIIGASSYQSVTPDASGRRVPQHAYRIYRISPNGRLLGDAYELPVHTVRTDSVHAMDGWLLFSLAEPVTRAVPMPVEAPQP